MDTTVMAALIGAATSLIVTYISTIGVEAYKHFKEGSAMAAALAGELSSYAMAQDTSKPALKYMVQIAEGGLRINMPRPEKQVDTVFEANVARLGLLGTAIVGDLVLVYHLNRTFRETFDQACVADPPMQGQLLRACLGMLGSTSVRLRPVIAQLEERASKGFIKTITAPAN